MDLFTWETQTTRTFQGETRNEKQGHCPDESKNTKMEWWRASIAQTADRKNGRWALLSRKSMMSSGHRIRLPPSLNSEKRGQISLIFSI